MCRRKDGLLTTGDMARMSDNTLRTVRFYEEAGILRPTQRTDGGHRLFEARELDRLRLVTDLRSAGFSLDEIREMLEAKTRAPTGREAAKDVVTRLDRQIESMSMRLELLQRLVDELKCAKQMLGGCAGCVDDERFPNACGSCEVMGESPELPKAVSVLWSVEKPLT